MPVVSARQAAVCFARGLPCQALALVLTAVLSARPAAAEVASLGLAGAYSLQARGTDAPDWNPAQLAWDQRADLRLFGLQARASNNSFTLSDYNRWIGKEWSEADKRRILGRISGATLDGTVRAAAEGPEAAAAGFALTVENRLETAVRVPRRYARLLLFGNTPGEDFDLGGTEGKALAWSEARLSYGREVLRTRVPALRLAGVQVVPEVGDSTALALGASVKYLRGWGYAELTQARGSFLTTSQGAVGEARFTARTAAGGSGYGLDVGAEARAERGWRVALQVQDLLTVITWDRQPRRHESAALADSIALKNLEHGSDPVTRESSSTPIPPFRASLPPAVTLAVGREWRRTFAEADLRQVFARVGGGGPRLAVGLNHSIWSWLDARLGAAGGGPEGATDSAGLGLRLWKVRLDLSVASVGSWNFLSPKGVGAGVDLGLRW